MSRHSTLAPSAAKIFAVDAPMPDAAPVIMATLSLRRMFGSSRLIFIDHSLAIQCLAPTPPRLPRHLGEAPEFRGPREFVTDGSALAAYRERPHVQSHFAQCPKVTVGTDRPNDCLPCPRAHRLAGLYFAALLHGSSNGLLSIRDRMVCRMDGEAKADKSIVNILVAAKSVSQA